jgi:hypothetical protein
VGSLLEHAGERRTARLGSFAITPGGFMLELESRRSVGRADRPTTLGSGVAPWRN